MSGYIQVTTANPTLDTRLTQRSLISEQWFDDGIPTGSRSGSGQSSAKPPSSRPASPAMKPPVTDYSESLLEESVTTMRARQQNQSLGLRTSKKNQSI
jgi:hypothetical protein